MAQAKDRFAEFVEALEAALDHREATGAELARALHLSRFHLDRLISAAAGEPPAALRRRVLLERAAYLLLTTRRAILDVALETGYSSHEAFTRAFARAYGSAPAEWRRHPTRIQIEAPNGVHFHPPAGLRLPARDEETPMDLVQKMVDHHVWLVGEMLDRSSGLTGAQLDTPIELSVEGIDARPTLRSLLARLVGQLDMWIASIETREYDFGVEQNESITHMQARLAKVGPAFAAHVREVCEGERLDETWVDTLCDPPRVFTYGSMIAHVLTFAAHRRTLAAGALYDFGVTDLKLDPLLWVVDVH